MAFTEVLFDIAKALVTFAVVLASGVNGIDGVIMGTAGALDYVLLAVMAIAILYLSYTLQQMRNKSY